MDFVKCKVLKQDGAHGLQCKQCEFRPSDRRKESRVRNRSRSNRKQEHLRINFSQCGGSAALADVSLAELYRYTFALDSLEAFEVCISNHTFS